MEITGIIVKVEERAREDLLRALTGVPHIKVYYANVSEIALVMDTDDIRILTHKIKELQEMKGVVGVYPIFFPDTPSHVR